MYSCHSVLESCNLFSGVKLSIRSFCFIFWQTMQTFDIMSKNIDCPSVNRFDGVIFLAWF